MGVVLWRLFSELVEQLRARGTCDQQEPLLCALLLAVLSGATSLRKMGLFIDERLGQLNQLFGTSWRKAPSWVGIRRFLLEIDEAELESAIRTHAHGLTSPPSGRQFIAIDGKALRGSASRVLDTPARQLVSAFDHADLIVLGHSQVPANPTQIPPSPALTAS